MENDATKKTAPVASVGADAGQSFVTNNNIITEEMPKFNRFGRDLETISMTELYDTVYPPKGVLVENLLFAGVYLFVGAPKIGKSFFMAQLAYHVATGTDLWSFPVHQGEVLYLALEDDFARIQKRLYRMFGTEDTEHLHFATQSMSLAGGLCQQLEDFLRDYTETRLVIVDTLQKVREATGDKYNYANDYDIVAKLKAFADKHNLCLLVVHHTRKMEAEDSFEMISGTNGLLGAADGAFIMQKKKRTDKSATLSVVGRDQQDQELVLEFDHEHCLWRLVKTETELWKTPPDPLLDAVAQVVTPLCPVWSGRPSELLEQLPGVTLLPHQLSRHLNANTDRLFNDYGITYENTRVYAGRTITLTLNDGKCEAP